MRIAQMVLVLLSLIGPAARAEEMPELATLLALFSANAADNGTIRLNWSLDQQSPAIVKFRVYRGYDELGNFSVLDEVPFHASSGSADYLYQDTSAIKGVTYFYKLAALGQLNESVFPVVISAAVPLQESLGGQAAEAPVMVLPGEKLRVYLRKNGHLQVERTQPERKVLVNGDLAAGVYEIDSSSAPQTLTVKLNGAYEQTITWPLR